MKDFIEQPIKERLVEPLGIVSGTIILQRKSIFKNLKEKTVENEFGKIHLFHSETIVYVPRHGKDHRQYILPHLINHQATFRALKEMGVKEVIGINSTGSLKRKLRPGTIVVPDDFIAFTATSTTAYGKPIHITPVISEEIRQKLIEAASECGVKVVNGGVYWQTPGPRLETKAEIAMMSRFADLVGMTMASEAAVAQELDLAYAALCSVDNYGHGLGEKELTIDEIVTHAQKNANIIVKVVARYLERRR